MPVFPAVQSCGAGVDDMRYNMRYVDLHANGRTWYCYGFDGGDDDDDEGYFINAKPIVPTSHKYSEAISTVS